MKKLTGALIMALLSWGVAAQNYSGDWYKISGGGITSAAGNFSISGTIGQPDATTSSELAGGNYSLTGGFWSLYAVQTPGAPVLWIYLSAPNTAIVAWLAPATGFVLQENSSLATTNWVNSAATINTVNGTNQTVLMPPVGNKYYRLFHP